jgi:P pilus assembly chaperone PapD
MKRLAPALILSAIVVVWRLTTSAAQLGATPRMVTIDAHHPIAEVSISSLRARTVIFDTRLERWEQKGESDTYAPANSFVTVPAVFALDPYATQLVRVAQRTPVIADREVAYRLSVIEVVAGAAAPPPTARAFTIPLFVAPAKVDGEIHYDLRARSGNRADVIVRNGSNTHAYIATLAIENAGRELFAGKIGAFVLAGNTRTIPVTLRAPVHGTVTLRIANEAGTEHSIEVQAP